ncbi:S9 family peptidase [Sphingomonas glacialis]|uniref:S9 family peptidase n=1 Tax=Sphingomonas glacialis TaxID=658225 RepID=A0A502G389_9SPHN|nr:alpha/beta fold hydrolase [Sphingomonas glacialis]TPG56194.1 S9 family peptidase [Sphingomonas glacialis]
MFGKFLVFLGTLGISAIATAAEPTPSTLAAAFGARVGASSPALSPDGTFLVYIAPGAGQLTVAMVMNLADGTTTPITYADGKPLKLRFCGWSAADRLVCLLSGISRVDGDKLAWSRLVAVDADGKHSLPLGSQKASYAVRQNDGEVLDWMAGVDGTVLMSRGNGAERVDTRTGKGVPVKPAVSTGWTDGSGTVRITGIYGTDAKGMLNGKTTFWYRLPGRSEQKLFSHVDGNGNGLSPVAVDGTRNLAYAVQKKDGRRALYSVMLDGTMKTDLVYADPKVDVDSVETIGRHDRVIGLRYVTDKTRIVYFDAGYRALAQSLAKALPKLSDIAFVSASADEKRVLLFAESDIDSGHYFLFDRDTRKLTEVLVPRADLSGMQLSEQRSITYPAADGTLIPAYLTLPPGSTGRHIPAIVMPHGGPAARDVWGFDWLPQFFAQRGYAVIQPQFRGSTGFGEDFEKKNGFLSWPTAIGDVLDAGRWMIAQGIADPDRLGVFGWSYGGYAALQANVVDPALFKAVVAVAPVTDLYRLKADAENFTNARLVAKQVGSGPLREQGSPDHYAARFSAPVLMFHGDQDINVEIVQSRLMDAALHRAGKSSRLIIYPGLDHQLDDSAARTDLLTQADAFFSARLRTAGR